MKRCPTCQTVYDDETLNFCLQDGTTLLSIDSPSSKRPSDATLIMSEDSVQAHAAPTERYDNRGAETLHLPQTAQTEQAQPRNTSPEAPVIIQPQKRSSPLLIAGVTAIIVLLLALVGIGSVLLFRGTGGGAAGNSNANANNQANSNSSPASQTNEAANKARNQNTSSNQNEPPPPSPPGTAPGEFLHATASASSTRAPMKGAYYEPGNALDGSLLTAWVEGVAGPGVGEWIRCDFDREVKLNYIRITPGYFKSPALWQQNNRLAAATIYFSDGSSRRYTFPDRMQEQKLETGGIRTSYARIVISEIYPGSVDSEDTPISQLSFEGEP